MSKGHWTNTGEPHSARVYHYHIGGTEYFPADAEAAGRAAAQWPLMPNSMKINRKTMERMARWLADTGIRQFIDVGAGLPKSPNLHEIVQRADPTARVIYADNDPLVLENARALLTSSPTGTTRYVHADVRRPESLLRHEDVQSVIDFEEPVAVTIIAMLQFIDDETARKIVDTLVALLAPGSYLGLTTTTADLAPDLTAMADELTRSGITMHVRTREQVLDLLSGYELVEPGVVPMHHWPRHTGEPDDEVGMHAAMIRIG
ncbi:SAM-dependent methyltransferase [Streptomyces sp. NPDC048172]|uniref:SAM-dependent methyltransferase n=1 Tax=Streptomyces sp. NPDC048172 TaxID=3365505 RepID=UPI0037192379